ncbi:MAG: TetR/AcrR family transcriptional regulator [Chloroflexota bacterium]
MYEHARERTRRYIIEATIGCLVRDGYNKLSVTKIANEADIGRGTFYRYFANPDEALLAICTQYFLSMQDEMHLFMQDYNSPEREILAWEKGFEQAEQLRPLIDALNHPNATHLATRFRDVMIQGFEASLRTNSFLYPQKMSLPYDVMATFTAGAVITVMQKWFAGDLDYSAHELAHMVHKMLYH